MKPCCNWRIYQPQIIYLYVSLHTFESNRCQLKIVRMRLKSVFIWGRLLQWNKNALKYDRKIADSMKNLCRSDLSITLYQYSTFRNVFETKSTTWRGRLGSFWNISEFWFHNFSDFDRSAKTLQPCKLYTALKLKIVEHD